MDISILIVNYNTAQITKRCIESTLQQKNVRFEILVADNASSDNSLEVFTAFGEKIHVLANKDNLGFGKANNQLARLAKGRYVCMLNPDTQFTCDDSLARMINYADARMNEGMFGVYQVNPEDGRDCQEQYIYPGGRYTKQDFTALPGKIAWVFGAFMMARRQVFEKIGGFDEDYFLHGEDADLCIRIRKAGFAIGYCSDVTIYHYNGKSYQNIDPYLTKKRKQDGLYRFCHKHYSLKETKSVVRMHAIKALWRMSLLRFTMLAGQTEKTNYKYRRYQAIYDLSKHYLRDVLVEKKL